MIGLSPLRPSSACGKNTGSPFGGRVRRRCRSGQRPIWARCGRPVTGCWHYVQSERAATKKTATGRRPMRPNGRRKLNMVGSPPTTCLRSTCVNQAMVRVEPGSSRQCRHIALARLFPIL